MKKSLLSLIVFWGYAYAMEKEPLGKLAVQQVSPVRAQLGEELLRLSKKIGYKPSDIERMKELILQGADVNIVDSSTGFTPLIALAANDSTIDVVKLLITHGANVNAQSQFGITALMEAAESGYLNVVRLLLEGATSTEATGLRHLRRAERSRSYLGLLPEELMEPVAHYKTPAANPNITDDGGRTALDLAIRGFEDRAKSHPRHPWMRPTQNWEEIIKLLEPITTIERMEEKRKAEEARKTAEAQAKAEQTRKASKK